MKHYIYALIYDETIYYIGISNDPKRRYTEHLRSWRQDRTRNYAWIRTLFSKGEAPIMKVFECVNSRETAEAKEKKYILRIRPIGNSSHLGITNRVSIPKSKPTGGHMWHALRKAEIIIENIKLPD